MQLLALLSSSLFDWLLYGLLYCLFRSCFFSRLLNSLFRSCFFGRLFSFFSYSHGVEVRNKTSRKIFLQFQIVYKR